MPKPRSAAQAAFKCIWTELTGKKFDPSVRHPKRLIASLTNAHLLMWPPRSPVDVFVREQAGEDCAQRAEIAGTYTKRLGAGDQCIGQAKVLAALNAAAGNCAARR